MSASIQAELSTRDMLARTVAPLVAVAASEDAEELCRLNHIPSFTDLIQPFGDMIDKGTHNITSLESISLMLISYRTRLARCANDH